MARMKLAVMSENKVVYLTERHINKWTRTGVKDLRRVSRRPSLYDIYCGGLCHSRPFRLGARRRILRGGCLPFRRRLEGEFLMHCVWHPPNWGRRNILSKGHQEMKGETSSNAHFWVDGCLRHGATKSSQAGQRKRNAL